MRFIRIGQPFLWPPLQGKESPERGVGDEYHTHPG